MARADDAGRWRPAAKLLLLVSVFALLLAWVLGVVLRWSPWVHALLLVALVQLFVRIRMGLRTPDDAEHGIREPVNREPRDGHGA